MCVCNTWSEIDDPTQLTRIALPGYLTAKYGSGSGSGSGSDSGCLWALIKMACVFRICSSLLLPHSCHFASVALATILNGGRTEWSGDGGEGRQPVRIAMLLLGKLDFHIYLHARFRNDSCAKCSLCGSSWKRKTCNILPELLLCINILISQLVKCQFSIWIFTIFTSQIYSHKFDNVLQIRIAWIVPQSVAIKSQIWSMLLMWPAQARRRNWSHVPGKCNTDTHTRPHTVTTPTQCILYACLQIAHTPCITQDQAANQQRVGWLQFAVIMAPNSAQIMLEY